MGLEGLQSRKAVLYLYPGCLNLSKNEVVGEVEGGRERVVSRSRWCRASGRGEKRDLSLLLSYYYRLMNQ